MLNAMRSRGFTLIELVVTMAVAAILIVLGIPKFSAWIHDEEIRTTAEAMQNALRLSKEEALSRNRQVVFALTNAPPALNAPSAANGVNWYAQIIPINADEAASAAFTQSAFLQGGQFGNQANGTTITGPAAICFNSLGRLVANAAYGCGAPGNVTIYVVNNANGDRPLHVTVNLGGQVRMCDPAFTLSSTTPQGC